MSAFAILATAHGIGEAAEKLGAIAVALLAAIVVLSGPPAPARSAPPRAGAGRPSTRRPRVSERMRAAAMLAALTLTPVLLVLDIWHTSQLTHLRHHPAEAGAAALAGLAVVIALALLDAPAPAGAAAAGGLRAAVPPADLHRRGDLEPADPALPGGGRRRAGLSRSPPVAGARPAVDRRETDAADLEPNGAVRERGGGARSWFARLSAPRGLEWLLAASVVLYGVQAAYSADFSKALENIVFFYVPFALLFALLREVRWTRELLLACLAVAVALAVVFAGIGFVEYHRKQLFLNPKVVAANQYDNYFRVNSLFFDPNIYGRFLALDDARGDDRGAVERAPPRGAARGRGAAVAAGGSGDELLAVEHRGAAARPGGAGGVPLGRARARVYVALARWRRSPRSWRWRRRRACTSA